MRIPSRSCTCDSVTPARFIATSNSRLPIIKAFLRAESRGRFFRFHIRDHFRYERMAQLRVA
jgi:hypothetical protein